MNAEVRHDGMNLRLGAKLEEDHVAFFRTNRLIDGPTELGRHRLGERALHPLPAFHLGARKPLRAHLDDVFLEVLKLLPTKRIFGRDAESLDDIFREIEPIVAGLERLGDGLEHGDSAAAMFDRERRQIRMQETKTEVRLIVAVFLHALGVIEARETSVGIALVEVDAKCVLEESKNESLERR